MNKSPDFAKALLTKPRKVGVSFAEGLGLRVSGLGLVLSLLGPNLLKINRTVDGGKLARLHSVTSRVKVNGVVQRALQA